MNKKLFVTFVVLVAVALFVLSMWPSQEVAAQVEEEQMYTLYLPIVIGSGSEEPPTCGFRAGSDPEGEILLAGEVVVGPAMVVSLNEKNIAAYAIYPNVQFTIVSEQARVFLYQGDLQCLEAQYEYFWLEIVPIVEDSVEPEPQPDSICTYRQPDMGEDPDSGLYLEGDIIGPAILVPVVPEGSRQILIMLSPGAVEHFSIPTLGWLYNLDGNIYCLASQSQFFSPDWYRLWIFPE